MIESAYNLRRNRLANVPNQPGCYKWWFRRDGAELLLRNVPCINWGDIQTQTINGSTYYALYFGIATKSLNQRLDWHINQQHTPSQIKSGTISTLRITIGSLLGIPASQSQQSVNNFMDTYCYVEYDVKPSSEVARDEEWEELNLSNYYPVNLQENGNSDKETKDYIKEQRSKFKKQ